MKKLIYFLCVLEIFVAAQLCAREVNLGAYYGKFIIPKGGLVANYKVDEETNYVNFTGQFEVSGTFEYGYNLQRETDDFNKLKLRFFPNQKSSNKLPYFKDHGGKVKKIDFSNPEKFIEVAVSSENKEALASRKILSVKGEVQIVVASYQAHVACERPFYNFEFISMIQLTTLTLNSEGLLGVYC